LIISEDFSPARKTPHKNGKNFTLTNNVLTKNASGYPPFGERRMVYRTALGIFGRNTASNPIAGR
jgi:hypothetical protein